MHVQSLEQHAYLLAGKEFLLSSPQVCWVIVLCHHVSWQQCSEVLFTTLKLEPPSKGKLRKKDG
jgi:hypothetical protein